MKQTFLLDFGVIKSILSQRLTLISIDKLYYLGISLNFVVIYAIFRVCFFILLFCYPQVIDDIVQE